MQEFHIIHGSVNPTLEMEVIEDGRYSFHRSLINDALQDSTVTFSMRDEATGLLQISKSPANIVLAMNESCEEKYILQYKWKERDTKKIGTYIGWFEINFNGNLSSEGIEYPQGNLKVPIEEQLKIIVI